MDDDLRGKPFRGWIAERFSLCLEAGAATDQDLFSAEREAVLADTAFRNSLCNQICLVLHFRNLRQGIPHRIGQILLIVILHLEFDNDCVHGFGIRRPFGIRSRTFWQRPWLQHHVIAPETRFP